VPTTIEVTLDQWISHVQITDVIADTHEDPILEEFGQIVMDQQIETREVQAWGGLRGGTSVVFNNGSVRTDINTALSANKLKACTRFLRAQRCDYLRKILNGSPDYATSPIDQAYVAVCSSDLDRDIEELPGFVPRHKYGNPNNVVSEFELGSVGKIRFVTHSVFSPFPNAGAANSASFVCTAGGAIDVYPIVIFGENAFGHTALRGIGSVDLKVLNPGTISDSDPAGQRGHITAKSYYKFARLNELWMVRLEVAATAL
jgi:N4-gp56 family major capsid protein